MSIHNFRPIDIVTLPVFRLVTLWNLLQAEWLKATLGLGVAQTQLEGFFTVGPKYNQIKICCCSYFCSAYSCSCSCSYCISWCSSCSFSPARVASIETNPKKTQGQPMRKHEGCCRRHFSAEFDSGSWTFNNMPEKDEPIFRNLPVG